MVADQMAEDLTVEDQTAEVAVAERLEAVVEAAPSEFPELTSCHRWGKAAGRSGCRLILEAAAAQQSRSWAARPAAIHSKIPEPPKARHPREFPSLPARAPLRAPARWEHRTAGSRSESSPYARRRSPLYPPPADSAGFSSRKSGCRRDKKQTRLELPAIPSRARGPDQNPHSVAPPCRRAPRRSAIRLNSLHLPESPSTDKARGPSCPIPEPTRTNRYR